MVGSFRTADGRSGRSRVDACLQRRVHLRKAFFAASSRHGYASSVGGADGFATRAGAFCPSPLLTDRMTMVHGRHVIDGAHRALTTGIAPSRGH